MRHAEFSFGRGAREHDERQPVLSRLHYGHHARFHKDGVALLRNRLQIYQYALDSQLDVLSRRRQIDRLSRGSAMSFPDP